MTLGIGKLTILLYVLLGCFLLSKAPCSNEQEKELTGKSQLRPQPQSSFPNEIFLQLGDIEALLKDCDSTVRELEKSQAKQVPQLEVDDFLIMRDPEETSRLRIWLANLHGLEKEKWGEGWYKKDPTEIYLAHLANLAKSNDSEVRSQVTYEVIDIYFKLKVHRLDKYMEDLPFFLGLAQQSDDPRITCVLMLAYTLGKTSARYSSLMPLIETELFRNGKLAKAQPWLSKQKGLRNPFIIPYLGVMLENEWEVAKKNKEQQFLYYHEFFNVDAHNDPFYPFPLRCLINIFSQLNKCDLFKLRATSKRMKYYAEQALSVRDISFSIRRVATGNFQEFATIPFRTLTLMHTLFNDDDLCVLSTMTGLHRLAINLEILNYKRMAALIGALNALPSLQELVFSQSEFTENSLYHFSSFKGTGLRVLEFDYVNLGSTQTRYLREFLSKLTNLQTLKLHHCGFHSGPRVSDQVEDLTSAKKMALDSLQKLQRIMVSLTTCANLTCLDLSQNDIGRGVYINGYLSSGTNFDMFEILKALIVPIQQLVLQDIDLPSARLGNFAQMLTSDSMTQFRNLRVIDLTNNEFSSGDIDIFQGFFRRSAEVLFTSPKLITKPGVLDNSNGNNGKP